MVATLALRGHSQWKPYGVDVLAHNHPIITNYQVFNTAKDSYIVEIFIFYH